MRPGNIRVARVNSANIGGTRQQADRAMTMPALEASLQAAAVIFG